MSKHTPGPWNTADMKDAVGIYDPSGKIVARIPNSFEEAEDRRRADAALMCAAPSMLEALEEIADFAPGYGDVCEIIAQRARAAIAKAYGEEL